MQRPQSENRRKRLYIFTTSLRPDPYVNVISHTLRHFAIAEVHLVAITDHGGSTQETEHRIGEIQANIYRQLRGLANGEYFDPSNEHEHSQTIPEDASKVYRTRLNALDQTPVTTRTIPWKDLDENLRAFTRSGRAMFDVTSLKKSLVVEIVALLLSIGCTAIYSFQLNRTPSHDQRDLIHSLSEEDYTYLSLAENAHIERAKRRLVSRTIGFKRLLIITIIVGIAVFFSNMLDNPILQVLISSATTAATLGSWLVFMSRD